MGDAGVSQSVDLQTPPELREIHVLVTGFGPFKSFTNNPSWLIASSLPRELSSSAFTDDPLVTVTATATAADTAVHHPHVKTWASQVSGLPEPIRKPDARPYKIVIHTYSEPVRVAYASTSALIPTLLNPSRNTPFNRAFDFVLHIGLASGRNSYTLETNAHRDHYEIPDVDDNIGTVAGEMMWRRLDVPGQLWVGWNLQDVETRWNKNVRQAEKERHKLDPTFDVSSQSSDSSTPSMAWKPRWSPGNAQPSLLPGMLISPATTTTTISSSQRSKPDRAIARLSRDAGRFLCEFILMSTLSYLWLDAQHRPNKPTARANLDSSTHPREKIGKAAFLHVPNGTSDTDIARGRYVAESAIRAIVASWEAGYRNPTVYRPRDIVDPSGDATMQKLAEAEMTVGGFESQGTGDE